MGAEIMTDRGIKLTRSMKKLITEAVSEVLRSEKESERLPVCVLITGDDRMRELNWTHRGVNSTTDVLSFPANGPHTSGDRENAALDEDDFSVAAGMTTLGDIAISLPKAAEQAEAYGHSIEREVAFLTVHGMLHLLGYNHYAPEEESDMKARAEACLTRMGLTREGGRG